MITLQAFQKKKKTRHMFTEVSFVQNSFFEFGINSVLKRMHFCVHFIL